MCAKFVMTVRSNKTSEAILKCLCQIIVKNCQLNFSRIFNKKIFYLNKILFYFGDFDS